MMTKSISGTLVAVGLLMTARSAVAAEASKTVATAGGVVVTSADLDKAVGTKLFSMETDAFTRKLQILNDLVDERLEAQEAAARHISVDDLIKAEVEAKAAPVDPADVNKTYEAVKARFSDKPEEELKKLIADDMRRQREQQRRGAFRSELRAKAGARILMDPPRLTVGEGGDPSKGPKDAPVTVVEFSDFQCPYCSRALPVVQRLQTTYGDKLRLVFRHYPLPMHPQAPKAAEAAACANDQGKFWEMHDRLFAHQDKLQIADLKASAAELGLDAAIFDECLDSGRREAAWQTDQKDGDSYGVQATPWFFINGRLLSGAQPYENFAQIIDDELQRKAPVAKK